MLRHWAECSTDRTVDHSLIDAFAPVRRNQQFRSNVPHNVRNNEHIAMCRFKAIALAKRDPRVAMQAAGKEASDSCKDRVFHSVDYWINRTQNIHYRLVILLWDVRTIAHSTASVTASGGPWSFCLASSCLLQRHRKRATTSQPS